MSSNTTPRVARAGGCPRVRRQHPYEDGRDGQIEDCGLCAVSQRLPSISTSGYDLPDDIPDATDLSQDAGARVVHAATALAAGGAAADSRGTARAPLFRTYARCKISSPAPQEPAGNGSVCSAKDRQPVPRTEETPLEACAVAGGGSGADSCHLRTVEFLCARLGFDPHHNLDQTDTNSRVSRHHAPEWL